MEKRCHVVDDKGEVIIHGGKVICELFKNIDCKMATHVLVKYFENIEDAFIGKNDKTSIFPNDKVYYFEIGD